MTTRVGYIGLGDMGKPMASHLAPAGFPTTVFDLVEAPMQALEETGAQRAADLPAVGGAADVLCVCVPTDAHVGAVLLGVKGALSTMSAGGVVAIHSTVLPETIEAMSAAAAEKGCVVLDACVTGGAAAAETGELTFLVGGSDEALEKARPVLEASSKCILHAGELGAGAKLKLAVNALTYVNFAAAHESYLLARSSGLDPELFLEAVRSNGQLSSMQERYLAALKLPPEAIDSEPFQQAMTTQMHTAEKDLAHALELARKSGLAMPAAGLVAQEMARIYQVKDPGRR